MSQSGVPSYAQQQQQGGAKLIAIALIIALVAVVVVNIYIGMIRAQVTDDTLTLYRLSRSLSRGEKLKPSDVEPFRISTRLASGLEHLALVQGSDDLKNREGNTFVRDAPQNALLSTEMFLESAQVAGSRRPGEGYRHISVPIRSQDAPGTLLPEMRIDLSAPMPVLDQDNRFTGRTRSVLVLEYIRVISVGDHYTTEGGEDRRSVRGYRNITIEVRVIDDLPLADINRLIDNLGPYTISIRNPEDMAMRINYGTQVGRVNPEVVRIIREWQGVELYR